jgi:hypothetical protein
MDCVDMARDCGLRVERPPETEGREGAGSGLSGCARLRLDWNGTLEPEGRMWSRGGSSVRGKDSEGSGNVEELRSRALGMKMVWAWPGSEKNLEQAIRRRLEKPGAPVLRPLRRDEDAPQAHVAWWTTAYFLSSSSFF